MWEDDDDDDNLHLIHKGGPTHFYRVYESVSTFEKGKFYSNEKDFRTGSLKERKAEAESYYQERLEGFKSGKVKFFYPFESPGNFKLGENAAYSLVLSLVEYYDEKEYYEYPLLGEDEETCADSREVEALVLKGKE